MKGYSVENSKWQELVNEPQLIMFANSSSKQKISCTKEAIKHLTKKGFKIEPVTIYSYEERYNQGE